jgi:hypothetical protein
LIIKEKETGIEENENNKDGDKNFFFFSKIIFFGKVFVFVQKTENYNFINSRITFTDHFYGSLLRITFTDHFYGSRETPSTNLLKSNRDLKT